MNEGNSPLKNARHERFAQALFKGLSASEAYRKAGYEADDGNAIRLTGNDKVKERVAWLQKQVEKTNLLTAEEKREFLALAVRTPIGEIDENHVLCQTLKRKRLTGRDDEDGWEVEEIKAVDKLNAIKIDNIMAGHDAPQEVKVTGLEGVAEHLIKNLSHGNKGAA